MRIEDMWAESSRQLGIMLAPARWHTQDPKSWSHPSSWMVSLALTEFFAGVARCEIRR